MLRTRGRRSRICVELTSYPQSNFNNIRVRSTILWRLTRRRRQFQPNTRSIAGIARRRSCVAERGDSAHILFAFRVPRVVGCLHAHPNSGAISEQLAEPHRNAR